MLGRTIAESGRTLVYGGGKLGLMGALADAALTAGGKVIGVIPLALSVKEVAHAGLTEMRVMANMHERKAMMAELADAFVAMPGGLGTLEELFEVWTWAQLGFHGKPVGLMGPSDFFAPLLQFLDNLVAQRFVHPEHRQMAILEQDPAVLLEKLARYQAPRVPKWLDRAEV